jgi:hypothetical protein
MSEMSNFFESTKSKIVLSTSIFAQVVDRTFLPSTIDRGKGGGERICIPKFQILKVNNLTTLKAHLEPEKRNSDS